MRWSTDSLSKERAATDNKVLLVFFFFSIFGYWGIKSIRKRAGIG